LASGPVVVPCSILQKIPSSTIFNLKIVQKGPPQRMSVHYFSPGLPGIYTNPLDEFSVRLMFFRGTPTSVRAAPVVCSCFVSPTKAHIFSPFIFLPLFGAWYRNPNPTGVFQTPHLVFDSVLHLTSLASFCEWSTVAPPPPRVYWFRFSGTLLCRPMMLYSPLPVLVRTPHAPLSADHHKPVSFLDDR